MDMASSSSSSAFILPQQKYDVFLSFRGADTRQKFTSYLYAALTQRKIHTYMDDGLERGDEIGPALMKAIEQSKLSIIIFSEHYASSSWCLDELVHILKRKKEYGQLVVPIFYEIDPSHVRKQHGSYASAFSNLKMRFKGNKVRIWKDAVSSAANLSGFDSQNFRTEAELVETVVKDILEKLDRNSSTNLNGLVGIESKIQLVESLLCIQAQDVPFRIVGIWGMSGIGKTTLADAVFHRHSSKFDACSFLANVREESEKHGIHHVRNKLLCDLLKDKSLSISSPSIGSHSVIDRLSRTKVLVVVDDVNDSSQLESLLGNQIVFGPGSRIIITSRDRRSLMEKVDGEYIYQVMGLNTVDALELFQSKAFKDDSSRIDYSELSKRVVGYADGIPLALKILSSLFRHCNSKKYWEDELNILTKFSDRKIQNVLRVSYDGLQEQEKGIFLDIACFFKGEKRCDAERMLEMHGFCPPRGIAVLIDMSLISISMDDRLEMHDLLQEMGRSIVREQCPHDPGKRSRLWNAEDVYQVLKNNTGTARVEAIFCDISKICELQLSPTIFRNMHNLRLLKFYMKYTSKEPFPCIFDFMNYNSGDNNVYLPEGLKYLPEELRYLYWDEYRSKSLPSEFSPRNLVELHMPHSQVERLWSNDQNFGNLKVLNLSYSAHLSEVPDLSQSPNIERINLSSCKSLIHVPPVLKNLDKLTSLDMSICFNLRTFPEIPCNMRSLDLSCSAYMSEVPDLSESPNIERINLQCCTSLVRVPSYFQNLDKLTYLHLGLCAILESIPEIPCNMEFLDLSFCTNLESVPDNIYNLPRLEKLNLDGCSKLTRLPPCPSQVGLCSLRELGIGACNLLEIPDRLICLSSLHRLSLSGSMTESIPESIKNVPGLRKLDLSNCKKIQSLPELPSQLEVLDVRGCTSLKSLATSRTVHQCENSYYRHERLIFIDCVQLDESLKSNIIDDAQIRIMRMASSKLLKTKRADGPSEDSFTVIYLGNEIPEWFSYRTEGCSIKIELPPDWLDTTSLLGFALSAVVNVKADFRFLLTCKCNFKTKNGEDYQDLFSTALYFPSHREPATCINQDHAVVFFNKRNHSNDDGPIPFNKVTEASFHFYPRGSLRDDVGSQVKITKCGIRMLYTHDSAGSGTYVRASVSARNLVIADDSEPRTAGLIEAAPQVVLLTEDENNVIVSPALPSQQVAKRLPKQRANRAPVREGNTSQRLSKTAPALISQPTHTFPASSSLPTESSQAVGSPSTRQKRVVNSTLKGQSRPTQPIKRPLWK